MTRPEIDAFLEHVASDLPQMMHANDGEFLPDEFRRALAFVADLVHPDDIPYLRAGAAALLDRQASHVEQHAGRDLDVLLPG